jgi:hypothetical protein
MTVADMLAAYPHINAAQQGPGKDSTGGYLTRCFAYKQAHAAKIIAPAAAATANLAASRAAAAAGAAA